MLQHIRCLLALFTAFVVFPGSGSASEYSDLVIADGAIHYWRFEETSTDQPAADEITGVASQTNNPGVYEGGIELNQPSAAIGLGRSAHFDGGFEGDGVNDEASHVALGTPQHPGDSFTVEAWFNLDADFGTSFSPIIARWDGSYELDINHTDNGGVGENHIDLVIRDEFNNFLDPASPDPIVIGQWHHVAATYDADDALGIVYLDGVPGEGYFGPEPGAALQDAGGDDEFWYIGRTRNPTANFAWRGFIDEVAIYDRALTEQEINAHILASSGASSTCDFDGDLRCNVTDLNAADGLYSVGNLVQGVASPPADGKFDLTGDGTINGDDLGEWLAQAGAQNGKTGPYLKGDTNLDGVVAFNDFVTLSNNFAAAGSDDWSEGDSNGDGQTNFTDFVALSINFLGSVNPSVAAVPEPSGLMLLLIGFACVCRRSCFKN